VNRRNLECGGRGELAPRPAGARAGDTAFLQQEADGFALRGYGGLHGTRQDFQALP
jgi:hypothetical protein